MVPGAHAKQCGQATPSVRKYQEENQSKHFFNHFMLFYPSFKEYQRCCSGYDKMVDDEVSRRHVQQPSPRDISNFQWNEFSWLRQPEFERFPLWCGSDQNTSQRETSKAWGGFYMLTATVWSILLVGQWPYSDHRELVCSDVVRHSDFVEMSLAVNGFSMPWSLFTVCEHSKHQRHWLQCWSSHGVRGTASQKAVSYFRAGYPTEVE